MPCPWCNTLFALNPYRLNCVCIVSIHNTPCLLQKKKHQYHSKLYQRNVKVPFDESRRRSRFMYLIIFYTREMIGRIRNSICDSISNELKTFCDSLIVDFSNPFEIINYLLRFAFGEKLLPVCLNA